MLGLTGSTLTQQHLHMHTQKTHSIHDHTKNVQYIILIIIVILFVIAVLFIVTVIVVVVIVVVVVVVVLVVVVIVIIILISHCLSEAYMPGFYPPG